MSEFYNTMPEALQQLVDKAQQVTECTEAIAKASIGATDHTSLKEGDAPMVGGESIEDITRLCEAARQEGAHTAAVCVYPNQIPNAKKALEGSGIALAVVNNFPHGSASAEQAAADAQSSAKAGADEIDTVIDYVTFLDGEVAQVKEKLLAVSKVCQGNNIKLKTILKASIYESYEELYEAAVIAIKCHADFVKTCTGKEPLAPFSHGAPDASDLLMAATVMQAVKDSGRSDVGVKISGGVKTPVDCARMKFLADNILGEGFFEDKKPFPLWGKLPYREFASVFARGHHGFWQCGRVLRYVK